MKLLLSLPYLAFSCLVVAGLQVPGRVRWASYRATRPHSSHLVSPTPMMKVDSAPDPDRYGAALTTTSLAVSGAAIFGAGINHFLGAEKALQYVAGYVVEMSLSVDNLFVFLLLFKFFKVRKAADVIDVRTKSNMWCKWSFSLQIHRTSLVQIQ